MEGCVNRYEDRRRQCNAKGNSGCFSSSSPTSLPLHPNVSPLPSQHLSPIFPTCLLSSLYWLALKAMLLVGVQGASNQLSSFSEGNLPQCHIARTGSCALDFHILTNTSSDDGCTCSVKISAVGERRQSIVKTCSFPMYSGICSPSQSILN